MDDHAGRLINHQQRLILIDDTDWDVLADDRPLLDRRDFHPHDLPFLGPVARLFPPAVDEHVAQSDQSGSLGPRKLSTMGDKQIEADIAVRLDGKLSDLAQG